MRRYAQETTVSVDKSKAEIEKLLVRYGATSFVSGFKPTHAIVAFEMIGRQIRFTLPLPQITDEEVTHDSAGRSRPSGSLASTLDKISRSRFRALLLSIKAKLESVSIGITTFEEEFLSNIVMPDGRTVGQHTLPLIAASYESGKVVPLLEGPRQ
jgi:hypothetical protein